MRLTNSIYFGAQAASILTIGLFNGPYSMSVLSFIEDLQKLEEMTKKAGFLKPPMTVDEKAKLKKLSF